MRGRLTKNRLLFNKKYQIFCISYSKNTIYGKENQIFFSFLEIGRSPALSCQTSLSSAKGFFFPPAGPFVESHKTLEGGDGL